MFFSAHTLNPFENVVLSVPFRLLHHPTVLLRSSLAPMGLIIQIDMRTLLVNIYIELPRSILKVSVLGEPSFAFFLRKLRFCPPLYGHPVKYPFL